MNNISTSYQVTICEPQEKNNITQFYLVAVARHNFKLAKIKMRNFCSETVNPANLNNLNSQPLEIVCHYRFPQSQVVENYSYICLV